MWKPSTSVGADDADRAASARARIPGGRDHEIGPYASTKAAVGPIDLKPVSARTGLGVSMKCAPS